METAMARNAQVGQKKRAYLRSQVRYPYYNLTDSVAVAHAIHHQGGGQASLDQLAAYLNYRSSKNGAYRSRLAAARQFGLIQGDEPMQITPLARLIIMPESESQARQALVDAFLNVELFRAVYDTYRGQELPEGLGLKNAMLNRFGIAPTGADTAISTLFDSAETAGFFQARAGSKTQLIIPQVGRAAAPGVITPPPAPIDHGGTGSGGGSGDGGGGGNSHNGSAPIPRTTDELRNEYVATLIEVLREQGKQGTLDSDLMQRIEKLLDLKSDGE